jgi:hypothetical protein
MYDYTNGTSAGRKAARRPHYLRSCLVMPSRGPLSAQIRVATLTSELLASKRRQLSPRFVVDWRALYQLLLSFYDDAPPRPEGARARVRAQPSHGAAAALLVLIVLSCPAVCLPAHLLGPGLPCATVDA